jgi:signal transduction histidine kinase
VRLGERSEFVDRTDQAVADRQVLRLLGAEDAICHPLLDPGGGPVLGVLVFPVDEEVDQEAAMVLYAEELARHLRRGPTVTPGTELLRRYRQREEKRLRELVHEANNPLAVVNNYLHILQTRLEADPETVSQLRLIAGELGRTGNLLAQVRDMSPLEEATAEPRLEIVDVDLNDLAGRVVELHRGYAADQDVALAYSLAPGPLVVSSDPSRLTQILNNLVRNAIEAAGGRSVTVGSMGGVFREGREGAVLTVRDTGPGLPREVLLHLAEPKQSSKPGDHAGLGLHIVHRLVAELEGSIDVQTGSGQGTTFTVFLPLSPA